MDASANPFPDYDPFASVYNSHWGDFFLPLLVPILETHVLPDLPVNAQILDLCCGTGQLSRLLSERGYRVTGLDGSAGMLSYATQNAPDASFIHADARTFALPEKFDAVVSAFDSLNHVMDIEELSAVFGNVYRALKPGGVFYFDLNMEPAFLAHWNGDSNIVEDDMVCIMRESYDHEKHQANFYATTFLKEDSWQRTDFVLRQRCYPGKEIVSALDEACFVDIRPRAFDIREDLTELTVETERGFFFCKKPL